MRKELRETLLGGRFFDVSAARTAVMRSIRSKGNRSTETKLRMGLVRAGVTGWQVGPDGIEGNPDFVFPADKVAVFADGCFWHACPNCGHSRVRTNPEYWERKSLLIRKKDQVNSGRLRRAGWSVVRVWEHQLSRELNEVVERIGKLVQAKAKLGPYQAVGIARKRSRKVRSA